MKRQLTHSLIALLFMSGVASISHANELAPVRLILVGDSTLASGNGYGDEMCKLLKPDVTCINLARNGRSSGSYRSEGSWQKVLELLEARGNFAATWVWIEFGHNDQPGKPGRSTDLETEFPANLTSYVDEVRQRGGEPVLATPLTRRSFKQGQLVRDLDAWADATRRVAHATQTQLVELLAHSSQQVQAMGQEEADTLAVAPPGSAGNRFDRTHIGPKGAKLFARSVQRLIHESVPDLAPYLRD